MPENLESPSRKRNFWCCCCSSQKEQDQMESSVKIDISTTKSPYSADLPKDFGVGTCMHISLAILPNCSRFSVNVTCGRGPSADIAFHLNPRLLQRYIVRNSRINGYWGEEETSASPRIAVEATKKCDLQIYTANKAFLVALNGAYICSFPFRIALQKVTGLEVEGNVDVLGVAYSRLETFPEAIPANVHTVSTTAADENPTPMDTPVTLLLPQGFQRHCQLSICGRVKILPHSFYINLQEGAQQWPHPIVHLHLNPRFSMGVGESLFIRNAWIDGGWGQEERTPGFQFAPGSPFTMAIRRGDDHFSVWIDGQLAGEFKFRAGAEAIDTVHIQGDLNVSSVLLTH